MSSLPADGKRLIITEKPSVAKDIVAALGGFTAVKQEGAREADYWENDDFVVTYAIGHLFELSAPEDLDEKYKRWTLDTLPILPESFPLKPKKGHRDRISTIKSLLKRDDVEGTVNACDAGREGELIFREIVEYLSSKKPMERLWLQSMTKKSILAGFDKLQPGKKYDGLSDAAHCRNYSDWLIGMNATRALTRRLKSRSENQAWSAGRVQTPTLGMLVDRELEIVSHVPVGFWRIQGTFEHDAQAYTGQWFDPKFKSSKDDDDAKDDRLFDEAKAKAILERLEGQAAVASETRKPSKEAAPPLFDLTSLQREGNRRYGWSARRTLNAAQRCYEGHKVLTYPRTDTKALPTDYRSVVEDTIEALGADRRFAKASAYLKKNGLLNTKRTFDDSKVSDHFAIIPTGEPDPGLTGDDAKLYDLVVRRFLASFFPPAEWQRVERITVVNEEHFRSRDRVLQVPGWRSVLDEGEASTGKLKPLVPGELDAKGVPVDPKGYELQTDETKPPARITEARLLSLMENAGRYVDDEEAAEAMKDSGIGTPATRADIIENLISKGYVTRAGRSLKPSVKGIRLIDILRRMKADRLASPSLTGELEQHLNDVERNRMSAKDFMSEVSEYAEQVVDLTKHFEFDEVYPDVDGLGSCPLCGREVFERSWFYRCKLPPGYDEEAARKAARKKNKEPDPNTVEDCTFRIWKDKSGRYVDRQTARELVEKGESRPLDGFLTRQGRSFRGQLAVVDGAVDLKRLEGGESGDEEGGLPEYEVDERPLTRCKTCSDGEIMETRATFVCSNGLAVLRKIGKDESSLFPLKKREIPEDANYCTSLLPRTVCKREITRDEATKFFDEGETEVFTDFISRKGRPFSAKLVRKEDNGRHSFEFPPRGGDADAGTKKTATKKTATKKKATTKKKAAAKKATTKKKAAAKKTAAKKTTAKKATTKKKAAPKKTTAKKAAAKKAATNGANGSKKTAVRKKAATKKKGTASKAAAAAGQEQIPAS